MLITERICDTATCTRPGCSEQEGCKGHAWREGINMSHLSQDAARRALDALGGVGPSAQPAPGGTVGLAPSRAGRVYLAGPMTGIAGFNFAAFNAAAAGLRASGIDVVNPAEHGIVEGGEWADYLRFDIAKIAICESIALLPGWSRSRGALLEVHIANALGMPVIYLAGAERTPAAAQAQPAPKDHEVREFVNALTAAVKYKDAQQLRERIASIVLPWVEQHCAWRGPSAPVVEAQCAECGCKSTPTSMWALYCLPCIEAKIIPALAPTATQAQAEPATWDAQVVYDGMAKIDTNWNGAGRSREGAVALALSVVRGLPSAPVGDGWQPIETAPKDGTWVLIARPEWDQAVVAKWDEYGYVEGSAGEVLMFGWIFRDTGLLMGGMECGFLGWEEDADSMPTHWTVAPPAARAAQAKGGAQ